MNANTQYNLTLALLLLTIKGWRLKEESNLQAMEITNKCISNQHRIVTILFGLTPMTTSDKTP